MNQDNKIGTQDLQKTTISQCAGVYSNAVCLPLDFLPTLRRLPSTNDLRILEKPDIFFLVNTVRICDPQDPKSPNMFCSRRSE